MKNLFKLIKQKVNRIIITLISTGFLLLILSVLIIGTDFFLRLAVGIAVIIIAYLFFYLAYKVWSLKKEIEKHLKF